MAKRRKPPELTFQQHIADYLVREHKYGVLEQIDITDTEHCIAEDQLWAFLNATQAVTRGLRRRDVHVPTTEEDRTTDWDDQRLLEIEFLPIK